MNVKKIAPLNLLLMLLNSCSTGSKDIVGTYSSPLQYSQYDCDQLSAEVLRIQGRVNQLSGRLDEASSNDKLIIGVGAVFFWPALFALGGTKQQENDLARLKGEYDAIQQAAIMRKCSLRYTVRP